MSKSKSSILVGGLAFLAIFVAIYYGIKSQELRKFLEKEKLELSRSDKSQTPSEIGKIDQLLLNGRYFDAIKLGKEVKTSIDPEWQDELGFRLKMAEKMRTLSEIAQTENIIEKTTIDTVEKLVLQPMESDNNKTDSLNFALEKAKVQLNILKKRVKQQSTGEYITFKTTKGNSLHYVGETKGGMANGFGIAVLDSGSRYEGEWKDNMRHGRGVFYWADGEHYEGEYQNDQRSGTGIYYWTNGEKYVGTWDKDMRNGKGQFYDSKEQVKVAGEWKDDKLVKNQKKG